MHKKWDNKNIIRRAAMVILICIFVFSSAMIAKRIYSYWHDNQQYSDLRAMIPQKDASASASSSTESPGSPTPSVTPAPGNSSATVKLATEIQPPCITESGNPSEIGSDGLLKDYSLLKKKNRDMIGWIQIPGFKKLLDYPVMQAKDNSFYLSRDFYKNYSYAGSIFMDSRNNTKQVERNLIIYGHAMKDFSMFGNLKEYPDKPDIHQKLTTINLDLMDKRLQYEVFSTYHENQDYNYRQTDFANDKEYINFLKRVCLKSVYNYGVDLTSQDRILTLSTCTNIDWNKRTILHARLVKQIVYGKEGKSTKAASAYKPSVKKAVSANVYLSQLSLQYKVAEKLSEAIFTPVFDTGHKEFSTELPPEVKNISLVIKTADPKATCELTMNGQKADLEKLEPITGQNVIKVKIISQDGQYARTYTINVLKNEKVK